MMLALGSLDSFQHKDTDDEINKSAIIPGVEECWEEIKSG